MSMFSRMSSFRVVAGKSHENYCFLYEHNGRGHRQSSKGVVGETKPAKAQDKSLRCS